MEALTVEQFKAAMPETMHKSVSPLLVMRINNTLDNEDEWEHYRDNLLGFSNILQSGKYKLESYLSAVRYCGYKIMGYTNKESHLRTFPDKHKVYVQKGTSAKDISSYVAAFNKSKLVMTILEQAMIPTYLLNADKHQEAINTAASIMNDTQVSPMVRVQAANTVLTHTTAPVIQKSELKVDITQTNVGQDYEATFKRLAEVQLAAIQAGGDVKQITNVPIKMVEGEIIDVG